MSDACLRPPLEDIFDSIGSADPRDFIEERTHYSDAVVGRRFEIPAGVALCKHKHNYSHLSCVLEGIVIVSADGKPDIELRAGSVVTIDANTTHSVFAVTDAVWMCIHARSLPDYTTDVVEV